MDELIAEPSESGRLVCLGELTGHIVLQLAGEVDVSNADGLELAINSLVSSTTEHLTIDVSDLRFIDSSGLAMLLALANRVQAVELLSPPVVLRRILEVTGVATRFTITIPPIR